MSNKTRIRVKSDGELLTWWREWLKALDAEMSADDVREAERRHERVEVIQRTIAHTPAEGLLGVAIKLALTSYLEGFADSSDGDIGRSAYLDTLKIVDRDFLAEAEAVLKQAGEGAHIDDRSIA
jgi:hypothetical protein